MKRKARLALPRGVVWGESKREKTNENILLREKEREGEALETFSAGGGVGVLEKKSLSEESRVMHSTITRGTDVPVGSEVLDLSGTDESSSPLGDGLVSVSIPTKIDLGGRNFNSSTSDVMLCVVCHCDIAHLGDMERSRHVNSCLDRQRSSPLHSKKDTHTELYSSESLADCKTDGISTTDGIDTKNDSVMMPSTLSSVKLSLPVNNKVPSSIWKNLGNKTGSKKRETSKERLEKLNTADSELHRLRMELGEIDSQIAAAQYRKTQVNKGIKKLIKKQNNFKSTCDSSSRFCMQVAPCNSILHVVFPVIASRNCESRHCNDTTHVVSPLWSLSHMNETFDQMVADIHITEEGDIIGVGSYCKVDGVDVMSPPSTTTSQQAAVEKYSNSSSKSPSLLSQCVRIINDSYGDKVETVALETNKEGVSPLATDTVEFVLKEIEEKVKKLESLLMSVNPKHEDKLSYTGIYNGCFRAAASLESFGSMLESQINDVEEELSKTEFDNKRTILATSGTLDFSRHVKNDLSEASVGFESPITLNLDLSGIVGRDSFVKSASKCSDQEINNKTVVAENSLADDQCSECSTHSQCTRGSGCADTVVVHTDLCEHHALAPTALISEEFGPVYQASCTGQEKDVSIDVQVSHTTQGSDMESPLLSTSSPQGIMDGVTSVNGVDKTSDTSGLLDDSDSFACGVLHYVPSPTVPYGYGDTSDLSSPSYSGSNDVKPSTKVTCSPLPCVESLIPEGKILGMLDIQNDFQYNVDDVECDDVDNSRSSHISVKTECVIVKSEPYIEECNNDEILCPHRSNAIKHESQDSETTTRTPTISVVSANPLDILAVSSTMPDLNLYCIDKLRLICEQYGLKSTGPRSSLIRTLSALWERKYLSSDASMLDSSFVNNAEKNSLSQQDDAENSQCCAFRDNVLTFVRNNPQVYEDTISFVPLDINALSAEMRNSGINISRSILQRVLDEEGIFSVAKK